MQLNFVAEWQPWIDKVNLLRHTWGYRAIPGDVLDAMSEIEEEADYPFVDSKSDDEDDEEMESSDPDPEPQCEEEQEADDIASVESERETSIVTDEVDSQSVALDYPNANDIMSLCSSWSSIGELRDDVNTYDWDEPEPLTEEQLDLKTFIEWAKLEKQRRNRQQ